MTNVPTGPLVSIIVPAHSEENNISDCLDSLLKLEYPPDGYEIIIVDDGSTDNTARIVREYEERYPNITLLTKPAGGKGSAVNLGSLQAHGKYISVIDSDTLPGGNYLVEMERCFAEDETVDVVTGRLYFANSKTMKTDTKTEAMVMAIMNKFIEAFIKRDLDSILALFTPDPDVVNIGTGVDERHIGLTGSKPSLNAISHSPRTHQYS